MASINNDTKPPAQDAPPPDAEAGKAWPAPMGMGAGGMPPAPGPGPGMGYGGYQPYQPQPAFGYPPQPMMPFPMAGGVPMMGPPQPYAMPRLAVPPPKKAATQVCTMHPEGLPRAFDVPFPEKRLPVCDRCKKNYRSRELCRQRDGHKALPWQTVYVVVTLTDEVLVKGKDGTFTVADIPMIAELQEVPELCRGPADGTMKEEPICPVCKEKNYTRDHCRNTLKHSTPPYQSIYVKLVAKLNHDEDGNNVGPSKKKRRPEENADGKPKPDSDNADENDKVENDDLTKIHQSKTFFAKVSSKKMTLKWCEQIRYPESAPKVNQPAPGGYNMMLPGMPPNNPNFQYQLWDAFRAGAQWVQSGGQMHGGHMAAAYPSMQPGYGQDAKPPVYGNDSKPPDYGQDTKPPTYSLLDTKTTATTAML